jgi:hypothetical protein
MLPHPYTAVILMEFEYQERLREAARGRLAASAQRGKPSLLAHMRTASHNAASWLNGRMRRPLYGTHAAVDFRKLRTSFRTSYGCAPPHKST